MRYMTANEVRQKFLDFFIEKQHKLVASDGLIPRQKDKSLLFTGAGMNQFKDMFLGLGKMDYTRATSSQKCLRTGDLDNVGRTAFHHTFFEMLGNFSFGDYFKKEAIEWAWEFFTKVLEMPEERLSVSVYLDDDEAYDIWKDVIGVPPEKIKRFGPHDNFWPVDAPEKGPNGPCGPCSEIFFDQGEEFGCESDCGEEACDNCSRYCEVWNLVFTQYERIGENELKPLPRKNIDTGMGFERLVSVIQGVHTNFDIDILKPIVQEVASLAGEKYPSGNDDNDRRFKRITDHVRAAVFCICDGVLPANDGAGYVLKKVIRRAALDGKDLGLEGAFLYKLVPTVIEMMKEPYPELLEKRDTIVRMIKAEEEKFENTINNGRKMIEQMIAEMKESGQTEMDGKTAFKLYDTYGYPLELIQKQLEPHGMTVDENGFQEEMSKGGGEKEGFDADIFGRGPISDFKQEVSEIPFTGYTNEASKAKAMLLVKEDQKVEAAQKGDNVQVVIEESPFYGESGGQVGDTGTLKFSNGLVKVTDTHKDGKIIVHHGIVLEGDVKEGDEVKAEVDSNRRNAIKRNHTATHLLHWALNEVIGEHVRQQGSKVAPDKFTFDYTHFEQPSHEDLVKIESIINNKIILNEAVETIETSIDDARERGAKALFSEKYEDNVRMVSVGDYSKELCGGTHVKNTGEIGLFKIISDELLASGIRRITAVTGQKAFDWVAHAEETIREASNSAGCSPQDLVNRVSGLMADSKIMRKEIEKLKQKLVSGGAGDLASKVKQENGINYLIDKVDDADGNTLRSSMDALRGKLKSGVFLLATASDKVTIVCSVTKDLVGKGIKAGEIVSQVARLVDGGGGGRPDMAQAGGNSPEKLDGALVEAEKIIAEKLNSIS